MTLQDGEEFGRGEKFYHFACFVDEGPNDSESHESPAIQTKTTKKSEK